MIERRSWLGSGLALVSLLAFLGPVRAEGYDTSGIAEDPELAARVPERIKAAGVITIGSDNAYAPWEYLAGDDGQTPEGIDVDLAKAIGATLGLDIDFQTSAFDAIIPSLGSKFDLGVSAFTITKAQMEVVDFINYVETSASRVGGSVWRQWRTSRLGDHRSAPSLGQAAFKQPSMEGRGYPFMRSTGVAATSW